MHEYALVQSVISATLATAEAERLARVLRLEVRIGELQQIDKALFADALRTMLPGSEPRLASTEVAVEIVPARLRCNPCGHEFGITEAGECDAQASEAIHFVPELAHAFLRCPRCKSPDFRVEAGRGVTIERIEGERDA